MSSETQGLSALILGATGATGRHTLYALLSNPAFTSVAEYGRRVTPNLTDAKLTQKTIDFEDLKKEDFAQGFDVVYITLGTTKKNAGSAEAFEKIDREYVLRAAEAARVKDGQHVVYLSSAGSSPTSPFLYPKSKGLTEQGLASLNYASTTIFRPGFLVGAERDHSRPLETAFGYVTGALSRFSSGLQIPVTTLGQAIATAGQLRAHGKDVGVGKKEALGKDGQEALAISNADALQLGKSA